MVLPPPLRFGVQDAATGTITEARLKARGAGAGGTLNQALRGLRYRIGYLIALHWNRWRGASAAGNKRA